MDRFNRPSVVQWSPGIGNSPVFVDLAFDYDTRGDNTARLDAYLKDANASPKQAFGYLTTFDDLRRMKEREEGELNGGHTAISTRARIESYTRNLAGRLSTDQISLNNDSDYTDGPLSAIDAGEMSDTRLYNKRNELTDRSYNSKDYTGSPHPVSLTYDKNGNLTSDGEKYDYVYPWGQLVTSVTPVGLDRRAEPGLSLRHGRYERHAFVRRRGFQLHPANHALRKSKMSWIDTPSPLKSARGSTANQALRKSKMSCTLKPPD